MPILRSCAEMIPAKDTGFMDKLYLIGDGEMLFICYPKLLNLPESEKWLDAQKIEYTERNIVDVNHLR